MNASEQDNEANLAREKEGASALAADGEPTFPLLRLRSHLLGPLLRLINWEEPQLHPSGRSAAERPGDADVHEPHLHHVGASAAVAFRSSLRAVGSREVRRNGGCLFKPTLPL